MEIVHGSALLVKTKDPNKITEVIRKSKVIKEQNGVYDTLVHWDLSNAHLLKNLGFNKVLSPILEQYAWPGAYKPFAHQKDTASFLTLNRRAFCLNSMGTGKTSAAAWAADYLLEQGAINRVLIICPLSIMDCAWRKDLFNTVMHRRVAIAHGTRDQRVKIIRSNAEFVIINYDGVETVRDELAKGGFNLIICDESTALKNAKTRRWKMVNSLVTQDTWLWLMTGTPAAQSPFDAYGQAKIVNPKSVPAYATAFKDQIMIKVGTFQWIPKHDAMDTVHKIMQPAIRYTTEECLDLPEQLYTTYELDLSPSQKKYYEILRKEGVLQAVGEDVTAVNAAVQMNKLLQISCIGYDTPVLTDQGWVPIQEVTAFHRVWDGEEWVRQAGAIFRGIKDVEHCYGVRMTLDHRVLTTIGWCTAGDILYGESSKELDRAAVRLPDSYSQSRDDSRDINAMCNMALPVRLWGASGEKKPIPADKTQETPKKLRLPSWKRNPQNDLHETVQQLSKYGTPLSRPLRQGLQELWCAWDNSLRKMAKVFRELLGRHGCWISFKSNCRPHRQQWSLCTGELSLGYNERAGQQHTMQCAYKHTGGTNDHSSSSREIWDKVDNFKETLKSRLAGGYSANRTNKRQKQETFDLLNCGPRSRFVVAGEEGPLIVHNCGAVYSDTGNVLEFDCKEKLELMLEVIQQASHKTLVFCAFRHSIDLVEKFLNEHGISTGVIHGGVSAGKRTKIFNNFQESKEPGVLIIQPQAAAHGVTLTAANVVIWFSPTTSAETYLQANARVHRAGQKNPCLVVHLCSSPVEKKLYKALENRTLAQNALLEMYKEFLVFGGEK